MSEAAEAAAKKAFESVTRKEQRAVEAAARRERDAEEREMFRVRMASEHAGGLPPEVADAVWQRAWDEGHSSGWTSVEWHYEELADFARMVRSAS